LVLIQLNEKKKKEVRQIAEFETNRAYRNNYKDTKTHIRSKDEDYLNRARAKGAEFALSEFLGFERPNDSNTFGGADIGYWVECKWGNRATDRFYIEKLPSATRKYCNFAYAFVQGDLSEGYEICGWLGGGHILETREAYKNRADRKFPSWAVAKSELWTDFETLRKIAKSGRL
jgi:hypothetical protein